MIAYDDLKQIISDDPQRLTGISINPFGQNLTLNQKELAQIDSRTGGMTSQRMDRSMQILIITEM